MESYTHTFILCLAFEMSKKNTYPSYNIFATPMTIDTQVKCTQNPTDDTLIKTTAHTQ